VPAKLDNAFPSRAHPERFVTGDLPPIPGRVRERPEDFLVDEIPLYDPCGEGEHIYLYVEKRGMATTLLVRLLARHFNVPLDAIGYAGLKDRHAITRQVLSVHTPGKTPEDFPALEHDDVTVLWADLHTNKLRRGHLAGNRFSIRIRGVDPSAVVTANRALRELERTGVPNRFGPQRFGSLDRNHLLGRALVLADDRAFLNALLGPSDIAPRVQATARALYEEGAYDDALAALPRGLNAEAQALRSLAAGRSERRAVLAVDRFERSYFVSALQSAIFNAYLDRRIRDGTFDTLLLGDVAMRLGARNTFLIDEARLADPAIPSDLDRRELSPTGPMWGTDMPRAEGEPARLEIDSLHAAGLTEEDIRNLRPKLAGKTPGARRPLCVPLLDPSCDAGVDEHGPYIRCGFQLPRGAFATAALAEVTRTPLQDATREERDP